MRAILQEVYDTLFAALGPQRWWPGETPFEVMVGAVLVQNTSWQNVKRAIDNLREADLLEPHALFAVPEGELEELIQPAGYYRVKAKRLRALLRFFVERFDGSIDAMFATPPERLREALLAVHGIGPETADSILLYAGDVPRFVIDAYTYRVFGRHGRTSYDTTYDELQEYCEGGLPADARLFNEYHALLVRVGKDYCHKSRPKCAACPLRDLLPRGGPTEPE